MTMRTTLGEPGCATADAAGMSIAESGFTPVASPTATSATAMAAATAAASARFAHARHIRSTTAPATAITASGPATSATAAPAGGTRAAMPPETIVAQAQNATNEMPPRAFAATTPASAPRTTPHAARNLTSRSSSPPTGSLSAMMPFTTSACRKNAAATAADAGMTRRAGPFTSSSTGSSASDRMIPPAHPATAQNAATRPAMLQERYEPL